MPDTRYVVLDTETTGLSPENGDRVIEIACLELDQGLFPTDKSFHTFVNPERSISRAAFEVHGISDEFVKNSPLFSSIAKDLWHFIGNAKLIIHNAEFDIRFLNAEFARLNHPMLRIDQTIDTLKMARKKYPSMPNNLDSLCKRFNISLEDREKHSALIDVRLLASVYIELTQGGRQQSFLQTNDAQTVMAGHQNIKRKQCQVRHINHQQDLEEQHKNFILQNFKKNGWGY